MDFLRGGFWNGRSKIRVQIPNVPILLDIYECQFNSGYFPLARNNVERGESGIRGGAHTQWVKKHWITAILDASGICSWGEAEK